jgi:hypothetical protein
MQTAKQDDSVDEVNDANPYLAYVETCVAETDIRKTSVLLLSYEPLAGEL